MWKNCETEKSFSVAQSRLHLNNGQFSGTNSLISKIRVGRGSQMSEQIKVDDPFLFRETGHYFVAAGQQDLRGHQPFSPLFLYGKNPKF